LFLFVSGPTIVQLYRWWIFKVD